MKKMFLAVAVLAVALVGCDKNDEPEKPQDNSTAKVNRSEYFLASAIFNNAFDEAGNGVRDVEGQLIRVSRSVAAEPVTVEPTITWTYDEEEYRFPVTVTVDYGAYNVLGRDGRLHRGKLIVKASGPYTVEGTQMSAKFDNWYVDDVKVACDSMEIQNIGRDTLGQCKFHVQSKMTLTTDSTVFTYHEDSYRTWIVGEEEPDVTKHTYSIVGLQDGVMSNKEVDYKIEVRDDDPMVVNVGTRYPLSGTLDVDVPVSVMTDLFPDYAAIFEAQNRYRFSFQLIFVGNNQAKLRFAYDNPTTGEPAKYETQPYDLTQF